MQDPTRRPRRALNVAAVILACVAIAVVVTWPLLNPTVAGAFLISAALCRLAAIRWFRHEQTPLHPAPASRPAITGRPGLSPAALLAHRPMALADRPAQVDEQVPAPV